MSRELSSKNDLLVKENFAKEREIRRLNKDMQKYEQTILNLRSEIPHHRNLENPKKDAEVMVGMSCTPEEGSCEQVRALRKVNVALSEELHALRRVCAALDEQCRAAATRTAFKDDIIKEMRRQLKQAKAKLKESESPDTKSEYAEKVLSSTLNRSYESVSCQPRRLRPVQSQPARASERDRDCEGDIPTSLHHEHDSDDCQSSRLDGSGDDCL